MLKLAGYILQDNKTVLYSLTSIFGIGLKYSDTILLKLNIDSNKKTKDLTSVEKTSILNYLENNRNILGINLKNSINKHIDNLIAIRCYRGFRHSRKLPVRGQRTRTNSKTNRPYKKIKKRKNKERYVKPVVFRKGYEVRNSIHKKNRTKDKIK